MLTYGRRIQTLPLFLALLLVVSCSSARLYSEPAAWEEQLQKQLSAGDYTGALKQFARQYDRHHTREMLAKYAAAAETVRRAADAAFDQKEYSSAGTIYRVLLDSGVAVETPSRAVSFDEDYLRDRIRVCSKTLTEAGLLKYREEKLDEAIAAWEQILAFDPENRTAAKAIETANGQLLRLKKFK